MRIRFAAENRDTGPPLPSLFNVIFGKVANSGGAWSPRERALPQLAIDESPYQVFATHRP